MPGLDRSSLSEAIGAEERQQREESSTRRLLKMTQNEKAALEKKIDILSALDDVDCTPPDWSAPPKTRKQRRAIANLMLSDLHLDEVVRPEEMRDKNAYNREIALQRLRRVGDNTIKMARDYVSGVTYDGLYLWVNGDLVSGMIHDELARTNDGIHVVDTIDYWVDPLVALYVQLADFFGKVRVVVSYGNHGRNYQKPPSKGAVRSSNDWLLNRIIYRELKSDSRFTWNIPESMDVRETVYSTRVYMHHGDDFKGGDQIAGAVRPVMMGDFRSLIMEVYDDAPYDLMLVGHFHQYHSLPRAVINGSVCGYNEYARGKRFRPETPQQAFWLFTPERRGVMMNLPIFAGDRSEEGW